MEAAAAAHKAAGGPAVTTTLPFWRVQETRRPLCGALRDTGDVMAAFTDNADDNPFLDTVVATDGGASRGMGVWNAPPSPVGPTRAQALFEGATSSSVDARERALAERERAVAAREEEVRQGLRLIRRHNWPRCFPILYHDISADIPAENQRTVRLAYVTWLLAASGYVFNFLTLTIAYFGGTHNTKLADWFFALLVGSVGLPASFIFWYQALYNAAQSHGGVLAYGRFFGHMSVHILFCLWMILALPRVGNFCAGIFRMIAWFSARDEKKGKLDVTVGFFAIANIALWSICGLLSIAVVQQAAVRFRASGGVAEMRRQGRIVRAANALAEHVPV